jgi:DNA-binding LacI/PurR family transcriptional regulator
MAVAGFDDIAIAGYTSPPLTSVRVNPSLLGERAVELLLRAKRTPVPDARQHEVLPTSLVIRRSCGAQEPGRVARTAPVSVSRAALRAAD